MTLSLAHTPERSPGPLLPGQQAKGPKPQAPSHPLQPQRCASARLIAATGGHLGTRNDWEQTLGKIAWHHKATTRRGRARPGRIQPISFPQTPDR
jgi:hypothetical protein